MGFWSFRVLGALLPSGSKAFGSEVLPAYKMWGGGGGLDSTILEAQGIMRSSCGLPQTMDLATIVLYEVTFHPSRR